MGTVYELRQILNNLVNAWPETDDNPTVREARQYLEGADADETHRIITMDVPTTETYHDAAWYSI